MSGCIFYINIRGKHPKSHTSKENRKIIVKHSMLNNLRKISLMTPKTFEIAKKIKYINFKR